MKNYIRFALILPILVGLLGFSASADYGGRKIVVFKEGVLNEAARDALVAHAGGVKVKNLDLIEGKVVLLSNPASEKALRSHPAVLRVDDDVIVEALAKPVFPQAAQVLPWGIDRVDAELVWPSGNTANVIKVGVIDTGISKDHPDLQANIKGGYNAINPTKSWNDDNGHGSHVAGIIGASNNTFGVVGIGPLVDLYAIKVLDRNGSGWLSDVIEGIDWARQHDIKVINLSLGTASNIQSMHDAVIRAKNAGVVVVAAAGNGYGGPVIYPAAYPEAIAVSATNINNNIASFSSRGPEVDLAAPGVSIYSTYKGTGYATLSGTSMASPHVTGAAALLLSASLLNHALCDTITVDGKCDPNEVQAKLQSSATDFGSGGYDNLFGWGLVNAFSATQ